MKFLILCAAVLLSLETVSLYQYSSIVREIKDEFEKFEASQDTKWKQIRELIDCRFIQIKNMLDPNKQRINQTNLTNVLDPCEVEFNRNNNLTAYNQSSEIRSTTQSKLPPIITKQPLPSKYYFYVNQYLTETQRRYTMTCEATGFPKPTYRWSKDGITLNIDDYDDRITASNNSGTIEFKHLLDEDEGVYQCFADNQYGTALSNTVYLRRTSVGLFADNETLKVVNAKLGHPLTLDCDVPFGDPKPSVEWSVLSSSGFTRIYLSDPRLTVDPDGRLHFSNTTRAEIFSPNYYCAVRYHNNYNNYKDGRLVKISVDSSESASENNTNYPITMQYSSPPNITALRGTDLNLYCIFGGTPLPKVSWYKKSGIGWEKYDYVASRARYGWRRDVTFYSDKIITVISLDYDSSGTYSCLAENGVSAAQSHVIELTVESVPHWTKVSNNINATEGQNVTLECHASAKPEPALQWYMNGIPIEKLASNSRRIVSGSVMRIENVSETLDTGVYQCNATNIHGYVFINFYLNVFAPNHTNN